MAEVSRQLHLWEDEPEEKNEPSPEAPETVFRYAMGEGGAVIIGAAGVGADLDIPAEVEGVPVAAIGPGAFQGSAALRRVTLPGTLRRIGRSAFQGCEALASVALPSRMEQIGEAAFQGCGALAAVALPEGLGEIADRAFYGCGSLASVMVPEGVRRIGERAFAGCRTLGDARLPEGLEAIGDRAFADCPALRSLRIPASVMDLTASALPRRIMGDGPFFLHPQGMLVRAEVKRDYALPPGTRSLAGRALAGNESLLTVDFGDALERVGPFALADCVCLKRAMLPDAATELGRGAFAGCERMTQARLSPGLKELPPELFRGCFALESVALPPAVESVGDRAFEDCRSLPRLTLPEGVAIVGERAFYRCTSLARLELPASLRRLGAGALAGCAGLRALVLRGDCDGEMLSVLADARRAAIVAPSLPPEAFPGPWRKRVCLGYALARAEGIGYDPGVARACLDWMRAHGDAFVAEALLDPSLMHLLADGDCLSLQAVQTLLDRAGGPDRDDYAVTLLAYRNRRFGGDSMEALSLW